MEMIETADAKAMLRRVKQMAENPARAVLEDIQSARRALIDHNQNCTACKRPGPKTRKGLLRAYETVSEVMLLTVERQMVDAEATFSAPVGQMLAADPFTIARATAATLQTAMIALGRLLADIHDHDPDLKAMDELAAAAEALADMVDARRNAIRSGNKGLN